MSRANSVNAYGLHGSVFDRNKNLGASPYVFNPKGGSRTQTSREELFGDQAMASAYADGRPKISVRNPVTYTTPDLGKPQAPVDGQPANVPQGPNGMQATGAPAEAKMPAQKGPLGAPSGSVWAPPTGVRAFQGGYADDRSLRTEMTDETMRANGKTRSMDNAQANGVLNSARNIMHLTRRAQGMGNIFGPRYYIQPLGGQQSESAAKFLDKAAKFHDMYEQKYKYHSTVKELKHTAAVIKGMKALPTRNPELDVPRKAITGSNRPVQFNTRVSDSRPEVPSVVQRTLYPPAETWLIQDRADASLTDKKEWLIAESRVLETGFHAINKRMPGGRMVTSTAAPRAYMHAQQFRPATGNRPL